MSRCAITSNRVSFIPMRMLTICFLAFAVLRGTAANHYAALEVLNAAGRFIYPTDL